MSKTIGQVCSRFSSGKSIKSEQINSTGLYPVYGGNGLRGYTDTYNFDGECVIIGRQGAYCGNVRYYSGKAYMTEHAIVACANADNCTTFLSYKLSSMNLSQYQGQSAQPGLSVTTLSNVPITLPDYDTQCRIAKTLSTIDAKISNNNHINAELESMAKTIYDYWFTQFDFPDENGKPYKSSGGKMVWNEELKREIPEGWEVKPLSYHLYCNIHTMKASDNYTYIEYLDTSNLTQNKVDYIQKVTSEEGYPSRAKRIVMDNDILYSTVRPAQCHYGIIKHSTSNLIASTGFSVLSAKKGTEYNEIFYLFITNESNSSILDSIANSSVSSYPSINSEDILNLKIALPSDIAIIKKIALKLSTIFEMISNNQKQNRELASLRDWLLPMLMNGQVGFEGVE